jgi:Transglycosylase SLT domain
MTIFTAAALATFITQHACCPPPLAPIVLALAEHESGLDTTRVHHNPNGTDDYGIAQINSSNFGWLGLTPQTALEPCANVLAAAKVFIVRYNGNGTDQQKAIYANSVITKIWAADTPRSVSSDPPSIQPCPVSDATGWHVTAPVPGCEPADADWHTTPHKEATR